MLVLLRLEHKHPPRVNHKLNALTVIFKMRKLLAVRPGFPGTNVLDDNLDTRWSNNGVGSWVQVDLGTSNKICDINIAWYKGNERQNNFVISTSTDGIKFSNVFSSKSSGSTLDLEKYNIVDTNARFVRITVNGNTQNSYASITEISVKIFPISGSSNYYIGAAGRLGFCPQ